MPHYPALAFWRSCGTSPATSRTPSASCCSSPSRVRPTPGYWKQLGPGRADCSFKSGGQEAIPSGVRDVAAGGIAMSTEFVSQILKALHSAYLPAAERPFGDISLLTPREMQVFRLVSQGLTNQQISNRLVLSEATVKSHFNRICHKLNLRNRVDAVILAYETGIAGSPGRYRDDAPAREGCGRIPALQEHHYRTSTKRRLGHTSRCPLGLRFRMHRPWESLFPGPTAHVHPGRRRRHRRAEWRRRPLVRARPLPDGRPGQSGTSGGPNRSARGSYGRRGTVMGPGPPPARAHDLWGERASGSGGRPPRSITPTWSAATAPAANAGP